MRKLKLGKLSKLQLVVVSEITRDSAQVIFAGMVVGQVFLESNQISILLFIIGTIAAGGLWVMSVVILKNE